MADIFLSYKREDRDKVRPLVEALQAQGWSVWWDTRIGVGETWDRVIETELAAAKCVVVVWSKLSVDSRWVRSEAHEGLERDCLVPVIIEGAKPPVAFKLIQTTNLTHWQGSTADTAFGNIRTGVERITGRTNPQDMARPLDPQEMAEMADILQVPQAVLASAMAYVDSGAAHADNGKYDRAIADFSKAIAICSQVPGVYEARADAYLEQKEYDPAIADFTKDIELNADDTLNYFRYLTRGFAHAEKRDYTRAIADCTKAIKINPLPCGAYLSRGRAYENRKRFGDKYRAIADYRRVLKIEPAGGFAQVAKEGLTRLGVRP